MKSDRGRVRLWDPLAEGGSIFVWTVVLIGTIALAASFRASGWPSAATVAFFTFVALVAQTLIIPTGTGGVQTLGPAVAAAGLTLVGGPATALALATGAVVAQGFIRRRPLAGVLYYAAQGVLATFAAGAAAHFILPSRLFWARAIYAGQIDAGFTIAMAAAAAAFVTVSAILSSSLLAVDRHTPVAGVLGPVIALEMVNTVVLFVLGSVVGLVATGGLPQSALFTTLPLVLIGITLLVYAEHRQVSAELETLHGATAELSRTRSAEDIVQTMAAGLERLATPDISIIWLQRSGESGMTIAHYRGPGGVELARQFDRTGLLDQALSSGRAMRVADYGRDARRNMRVEILFGPGVVRSALVVPMMAGGEACGAVALIKGLRAYFTARHERLAVALASEAAVAIRFLSLREENRRQADRLAALQQVGSLTGPTLDPANTCQQLVARAAELLSAPYAFLALYDGRAREVYGQSVHGADAGSFARLRIRIDSEGGGPLHDAVRAIRERRAVVCDESQVASGAYPTFRDMPEVRCALSVPLLAAGKSIGALTVADVRPHPFTDNEVAALEAIAAQGTVMIAHARVHAAAETRLRQLETLLASFRRLGGALDLRAAFAAACEGAREILGTDRCLLLVWDGHDLVASPLVAGLSDDFVGAAEPMFQSDNVRHMIQIARPMTLVDFFADQRTAALREAFAHEGVRAGVVAPLRVQREALGLLFLLNSERREVTSEDLVLVETFADQVSLVARNALLLVRGERRREELAVLNRIVGSVSASLDLTEVFHKAASELVNALGIPRVALYRIEGQYLRLAAQVGSPDAAAELPVTAGVAGRVVRSGRPEFVPNVRDDPDYVASSFDVTSMAVVPIMEDGGPSGILRIEGNGAQPVTQPMFEFLIAFGHQLSIAARNAAFYQELSHAHDELQVLYEAAKAVSGTLDLRTVLDSLVSVTCRAFGYENGALFMVESNSAELTVEAAFGYRETVIGTHLPAGAGVVGLVARTGTPLVVNDVRKDPRYKAADERTRSELAVPLIAEGKVLGVFNVESARPAAFGARDLRLLTTVASYAVVAIQNARLYEHARRLAITDGLTELYNHRHLHETLDRVLERSRRDGTPLALIMLEIDRFKRYNDTYGHQSGDEALRTVAGLLRRGSRPSDVVARYGGDEFMVILPGATKAAAQETAERLRRAVEAYPLILAGEVITTVTLSVGVAAHPQDGDTVDALVEAVDRAQYIAKRSGGNKVHVAHGP